MKQQIAPATPGGNVKLQVASLSFSEIPHQSRLFLEYQRDPVSHRKYYPNAVGSYKDIPEFVPEVLANYKTDRNLLCDALAEINIQIGSGLETLENIKLLRDPETVAVVTGQQAGLFTGPLYTLYKALSTIKMAEQLNSAGVRAVPVFWVATEDHDFDEVSRSYFVGNADEVAEATYQPGQFTKDLPVGGIELDASIRQTIEEIFTQIPSSELTCEVRRSVEKSWAEGTLYGIAFATELAAILARFGIIFIDPMNEGLKQLASPVYVDAIECSEEIVANIRNRNAELEAENFHAQVLVEEDYFPLFWHDHEGRRLALRKVGDDTYRAKGENHEFTRTELAAIAKNDPRRFSPGVMLRPVVQDYLLPTVCYFGGAAEIAYFAQNSEAYRILERPVTPILHRQSFTVVEAKQGRAMDKFGLELSDLFAGFDSVLENVGKKQLSSETANIFAEAEETINSQLNRLDQNLSSIDPTLLDNLAKRRRKIIYHIETLKKKIYLAQIRRDATVERQLRSVFATLMPQGQLQERVLNVNSFLSRYGNYFVDWIYKAIDLDDKGHRIIQL